MLAYRVAPSLLTLDTNGELGVKIVNASNRVAFYRVKLARSEANGVWVTGLPDSANIIVVGQGYVLNDQLVESVPVQAERAVASSSAPAQPPPAGDDTPMNGLIDLCVNRSRAVLVALMVLMFAGAAAYRGVPKEAQPDVDFPFISVEVLLDGVAAEDAERLLVRPLEQQLRNLEGLKEMIASATENRASVTLEFGPEVDVSQALTDVRERVDQAKALLPDDAREPTVNEVKFSRFDPMLVINLGARYLSAP